MRFKGQLLQRHWQEGEDPMAEQHILDDEEVNLRVVQAWPRNQQVHLARRILDPGLATLDPQTGRPTVSSAELCGIGAGNRAAPSDEEIERWRMEKHAAL